MTQVGAARRQRAATLGPSDPPRETIELAGGKAAYTDEGTGSPIVAVHGCPGSLRDFRWLAFPVSRHARFIRVDLPGFGATPVATEPDPSPGGQAGFLLSFIRALGLERPLLVGHSMGGLVGCAAVDLAPDAFCGLALLSSAGLRPHKLLRRLPHRFLSAALANPTLNRALWPIIRRAFPIAGFRGYPDHELSRTIHVAAQLDFDAHADRVRKLVLPTLVAFCEDDPLVQWKIGEELAAACPHGPRLRYESGGHNPQKTHAAEIAETIIPWLAELRG